MGYLSVSNGLPGDLLETKRYLSNTPHRNACHLNFWNASRAAQKDRRRLDKIMYRIAPVVSANTETKVAATLSHAKASLGRVPNFIASLALAGVIAPVWFIGNSILYENTDDAKIEGHITRLSARINGELEQVHVVEGQLVHAGDVLAVMDQKEYKIALYQAMANVTYALDTATISYFNVATTITDVYGGLNSAQAALKNAESQVAAAERKLQADEVVSKQAQENATKADSEIVRHEQLSRYENVGREQRHSAEVNSAEAVVAADQEKLLQAREKLVQAKADVKKAQTGPLRVSLANAAAHAADAQVSQRKAQLEQAQLNLSYTIIRSPVTGIVGKRQIEVGQDVSVGQELIDVVSLDDVWITANFKEAQLVHLRPGEPVQIKVDAYGRTWKGHLTNVGGTAGSVFSAMPPRAAIGNQARVVKRVPVRIDFDRPQSQDFNAEGLLKPGLSVEPEVRVRWLPRTDSSNSLPTRSAPAGQNANAAAVQLLGTRAHL